MASLPEQHREFVLRLIELGPSKKSAARAAEAVGFSLRHGYKLLRDQRVLEAIREEVTKKLQGAVLVGVNTIIEIASDKDHKDQFKAAKYLAELNGFTAKQRIVVEHVPGSDKDPVRDIKAIFAELGIDASPLLKALGVTDFDTMVAEVANPIEVKEEVVKVASLELRLTEPRLTQPISCSGREDSSIRKRSKLRSQR